MSSHQAEIISIKKSMTKCPTPNTKGSLYEKCKNLRPLYLKIIRMYDNLKHVFEWSEFWRVVYIKTNEFLRDISIQRKSIELKVNEENYINKYVNNLKKVKRMCEDTSITYYSLLPDRMPIDVRTYCIQFISQAITKRK
jgi:hypothetical protein